MYGLLVEGNSLTRLWHVQFGSPAIGYITMNKPNVIVEPGTLCFMPLSSKKDFRSFHAHRGILP